MKTDGEFTLSEREREEKEYGSLEFRERVVQHRGAEGTEITQSNSLCFLCDLCVCGGELPFFTD
jgi:hypothetical protein